LSLTPAGYEQRTTLIPLAASGSVPTALSGVKILENNPGAVMLEAAFQAGDGMKMALQCQLSVGQSILEIRPTAGVARLRLQAASRYVVIPDFFGDDMVFTPDTLLRERITLPAENFFLTPLGGGTALLMCVSSTRMQNAEAIIAGPASDGASRVAKSIALPARASGWRRSTVRDFGTTGRFRPPTFRRISSWIGNRRFRPSGGPILSGPRGMRDPGTSLAGKGRTRNCRRWPHRAARAASTASAPWSTGHSPQMPPQAGPFPGRCWSTRWTAAGPHR
jgi:hypothetical protein